MLLDAIQRHDEEAAYTLMLHHVAEIQDRVGRALARERRVTKAAARTNGARAARLRR
jgi:DNA-binding GntR family transcriptional regulator